MKTLALDGSSRKRVFVVAILFMGLAHLTMLKQYIKGAIFALIEIVMIILSPLLFKLLRNMVTLGEPKPELPIFERDNSMFMLIDGILILAVLFVFLILYVVSVRSALSTYKDYCVTDTLPKANIFYLSSVRKLFR